MPTTHVRFRLVLISAISAVNGVAIGAEPDRERVGQDTLSADVLVTFDAFEAFPADIDPVSHMRLPIVNRADLDAEGQRVFDMVVGTDRADPMRGPGGLSLYSPRVAEPMHHLNQYLRYHGLLNRRHTETAILVAAREFDQQYEWTLHEDTALEEGVPQRVIDAIKYDLPAAALEPADRLIIRFGRQIFRDHRLDSATFTEAVALFGPQGAVELAAVMGDYVMAAVMLHAVDHQLPPDRPPLLPVIDHE